MNWYKMLVLSATKGALFVALFAFFVSLAASSDCQDGDRDGHPESCTIDGEWQESEDNCPNVFNPDQTRPYVVNDSGEWEQLPAHASDGTLTAGARCFYDINRDGNVQADDLYAVFKQIYNDTQFIFFGERKDMIGDLNGTSYDFNGHVLWVDFDDYFLLQCVLIHAEVLPYNANSACTALDL